MGMLKAISQNMVMERTLGLKEGYLAQNQGSDELRDFAVLQVGQPCSRYGYAA